MSRRPLILAFCVLPWAIAIAGLGWLLVQRFPPAGIAVFDVPFDGRSAWINAFLPAERVTSPGAQEDGWRGQRIFGDPVYTSARIPGVYDAVAVELEFRPIRQPLMELGLVKNAEVGEIIFSPVWFEPLQDTRWRKGTDGFYLENGSKDTRSTALWRATSSMPLLMDPPAEPKTTRVTLRGAHDFYAVPVREKDGDFSAHLQFAFEIQDANRSVGPDTVVFRVFRGSQEISTDALGIGGSRDARMGVVSRKNVQINDLTPGVYRIQVIADDDVFIRSITTDAQHWVVGPRLVFGDDVGYATTTHAGVAWTDSRHFVFETFHKEGLQRVSVGTQSVQIVRTHELVRLDRTDADNAPQRVDVPRGDVRLIGDGWFSFSPDAWFAPQPRRITDGSDPLREGMTRIVTPYQRPEAIGDGWYRAKAVFALDPTQDTLRIALSTPGIVSRNGAVDIRHVRLTYQRPPLSWDEWRRVVWLEVRNAWRRLKR